MKGLFLLCYRPRRNKTARPDGRSGQGLCDVWGAVCGRFEGGWKLAPRQLDGPSGSGDRRADLGV
jgi:hypothetical protein